MQYFKAPDNSLHALSNEDIANGGKSLLPIGCMEITEVEAETIRAASAPPVIEVAPIDPLDKLRTFLAANPDVAALL